MSQLDEKQQKGFWEKFDKTTKEYEKRSKSEQLAKIEDRFEMFFSDATPEQLKLLHSFGDHQVSRGPKKAQLRNDLRQKIISIYTEAVSPQAKAEAFTIAYNNYQEGLLDDEKNIILLKSLMPTLSDKQRAFFKEKVVEVEELAKYFLTKEF